MRTRRLQKEIKRIYPRRVKLEQRWISANNTCIISVDCTISNVLSIIIQSTKSALGDWWIIDPFRKGISSYITDVLSAVVKRRSKRCGKLQMKYASQWTVIKVKKFSSKYILTNYPVISFGALWLKFYNTLNTRAKF